MKDTLDTQDQWTTSRVQLANEPDFEELVNRHNVDRGLVTRLILLVVERHYGSVATDTSLREDVEAELAKAEQRAQ